MSTVAADEHRQVPEPAQPATSLVQGTQLGKAYAKTFPTCGESIIVRAGSVGSAEPVPKGEGVDPLLSAERSARRRRGRVRRYLIHNRLHRLWTLTYAVEVWDYDQVKRDLARFFKKMRGVRGEAFPYLWVIERHPGGHGLHVHVAMRGFIRKASLQEAWGRGIVHFSDRRKGAIAKYQGAELAAYFAKELSSYITKEASAAGEKHFYDVAQNFQPDEEIEWLGGEESSIIGHLAGLHFGGEAPHRIWRSEELGEQWDGPPVTLLYWYGESG